MHVLCASRACAMLCFGLACFAPVAFWYGLVAAAMYAVLYEYAMHGQVFHFEDKEGYAQSKKSSET